MKYESWDSTLYALDRSTGKLIWKWTGCHPGMHYSPAAVWPVAAHNKVFIADPQRALSAIDLKTGKTLWRTLQSQVRETIGLSADKKRIYSKTMNDSIVCYSTLADKPQEVWASSVGFGYEHDQSLYVGIRSTFYRVATLVGQGLLVIIAGLIETNSGLPPARLQINADPAVVNQTYTLPVYANSIDTAGEMHFVYTNSVVNVGTKAPKTIVTNSKGDKTAYADYSKAMKYVGLYCLRPVWGIILASMLQIISHMGL